MVISPLCQIENGLSLEEAEDEPVVTIEVTGSDQDEQEVENAEEDKEKGEEKEELLPTQLEGIVEKEDEEEVVTGDEEEEEEEKLDREEAIEMYKVRIYYCQVYCSALFAR